MAQFARTGVLQNPTLRQFIKFCIIGLSSMIIDVSIWKALMKSLEWHWIPAQIASFAVAVSNGFLWNSLWTFRGLGSGARHKQYLRFLTVNILGLILNIAIMKGTLILLTGQIIHHDPHAPQHLNIAKGLAVVCVAFWNFFANRKWTFTPAPEA